MGAERSNRIFSAVYGFGVALLPSAFRKAHGAELRALVAERMRDARSQGGIPAAASVFRRELFDVLRTAVHLRRQPTSSGSPRKRRNPRFTPADLLLELRMAGR